VKPQPDRLTGVLLLLGRPFFMAAPNEGISHMKKTITEFLPQPHPTKQIFVHHKIPVAAVAQFLWLSTSCVCSLLNEFARVSLDNDKKLREFARRVECEVRETK